LKTGAKLAEIPLNLALTDDEVIQRVRNGETALFEIIMRRYNQRLFRLTRAVLRNDTEAEDVIQETYVRAFTHLNQFAGDAKFSTWLTRIAIHESLARLKRYRKIIAFGDEGKLEERMQLVESQTNPEDELMHRQLGQVLESVIDSLPPKYRAVFALRDLQGLSTIETAECLQIGEEAVKTRLFRARALLRKRLDAKLGAGLRKLFQFDGERCDRIVHNVMQRITA
jgi:RNA polymerase sigma-70 factor, ECF subfamily